MVQNIQEINMMYEEEYEDKDKGLPPGLANVLPNEGPFLKSFFRVIKQLFN